ncbi:putative histone deacetylase 6, partial [Apostichopus japonicus]
TTCQHKKLTLCHTESYIKELAETRKLSAEDLDRKQCEYNSIYLCPDSYDCALLATGSLLNVVDTVLTGKSRSGVAIVRPPGHHADAGNPAGFCFFNSAPIAMKHAQKKYNTQRILIVDWDVHHGNGTQNLLERDPGILYISLHRFDDGTFYPGSSGDPHLVGKGLEKGPMGDAEYLAAFRHIIMPIAYEYNPELVLISAGFDAARGDPLGGYDVTPEGYGLMTHMLSSLAGGKVIMVLEYWKSAGYQFNLLKHQAEKMEILLEAQVAAEEAAAKSKAEEESKKQAAAEQAVTELTQSIESLSTTEQGGGGPKLQETGGGDQKPASGEIHGDAAAAGSLQGAQGDSSGAEGGTEELMGAAGGSNQPIGFQISALLSDADSEEASLFAVTPLSWCPHLEAGVKPLPAKGLDVTAQCQICSGGKENWVCLTCYQVFCGRYINEHMVQHGKEVNHPVVLSYADLSVWCYGCEQYVHNEMVLPAKRAAHLNKFGEDMPT